MAAAGLALLTEGQSAPAWAQLPLTLQKPVPWPPYPHGNGAPALPTATLPEAGLWLQTKKQMKVSVRTRGQGRPQAGTSFCPGSSPYLGHHDGRVEIPAPGDAEAPGRRPCHIHGQRHPCGSGDGELKLPLSPKDALQGQERGTREERRRQVPQQPVRGWGWCRGSDQLPPSPRCSTSPNPGKP